MTPTLLEYLDDTYKLASTANVVKTEELPNPEGKNHQRFSIVLDKTIFYPQGGGQPYDTGFISSKNGKFLVQETRFSEGLVNHIGVFETGFFQSGDNVGLSVNGERRLLLSKLHTAGHLLDVSMINLGYELPPTKGYHFPDSPYVEYAGEIPVEERKNLCIKLEAELKKMIAEGREIKKFIVENEDELKKFCKVVPDYIPKDKPVRIVAVAGYNCPCGGTHVKNTSELGNIQVTKIKVKGGNVRVSYNLL